MDETTETDAFDKVVHTQCDGVDDAMVEGIAQRLEAESEKQGEEGGNQLEALKAPSIDYAEYPLWRAAMKANANARELLMCLNRTTAPSERAELMQWIGKLEPETSGTLLDLKHVCDGADRLDKCCDNDTLDATRMVDKGSRFQGL